MFNEKIFSDRLKSLRQSRNLSLQQLGNALGMTKSAVGNLEHCRKQPSMTTVLKIAEYFNVPTDYLLGQGLFANFDTVVELKDVLLNVLYEKSPEAKAIIESANMDDIRLVFFLSYLIKEVRLDQETSTIDVIWK